MTKGVVTRTVFLVSCVSRKRSSACPAKDLYISPWFIRARALVEATHAPWFILSAKHGLVKPNATVEPYEETLTEKSASERRDWARRVIRQLVPHLSRGDRLIIFAGARYREFLVPSLRGLCPSVEAPLAGLAIGQQLQWLKAHTVT